MSHFAAGNTDAISLAEADDVRGWCEKLACSEVELRVAVDAVGPSANWVSEYLMAQRRRAQQRSHHKS